MSIPLTITENAKERLTKMLAMEPGAIGLSLSLAKNKGCGGNEYKWGHVKETPVAHDVVPVTDAFSLYIPVLDSYNMFGMVIDFNEDKLGNAKFEFKNPKETGRCGCGDSVSFKPL